MAVEVGDRIHQAKLRQTKNETAIQHNVTEGRGAYQTRCRCSLYDTASSSFLCISQSRKSFRPPKLREPDESTHPDSHFLEHRTWEGTKLATDWKKMSRMSLNCTELHCPAQAMRLKQTASARRYFARIFPRPRGAGVEVGPFHPFSGYLAGIPDRTVPRYPFVLRSPGPLFSHSISRKLMQMSTTICTDTNI